MLVNQEYIEGCLENYKAVTNQTINTYGRESSEQIFYQHTTRMQNILNAEKPLVITEEQQNELLALENKFEELKNIFWQGVQNKMY